MAKIKINEVYGIYTVQKELSDRDKSGHLLYELRCSICNKIFVKPANSFASPSSLMNVCRHLSKEEIEQKAIES